MTETGAKDSGVMIEHLPFLAGRDIANWVTGVQTCYLTGPRLPEQTTALKIIYANITLIK